jgi:DNA-directed RNA polymerase omega subunit
VGFEGVAGFLHARRIATGGEGNSGTMSMERILKIVPNRYEAIRVMAKEARRVNSLIRKAGEELEEKPTSIAMNRVIDGKVKFEYEEPEGDQ